MPLEDLIPIGISRDSTNIKKENDHSLTSGLISIPKSRDNDVDMSDFDVGDLLGDDSSKSLSKTSLKSKHDKKKTKTKDKVKKLNTNKAKTKLKSKKTSHHDEDMADNWTSSTKTWDSAAELELAAARRKNGSGKIGSGLDDELTKMLGENSGIGAEFGQARSIQMEISKFDKNDSIAANEVGSLDTLKRRGRQEVDTNSSAIEPDGISASFFNDTKSDDMNATSRSSLLTAERRGGARGGRRQASAEVSDPFGIGATTTSSDSPFEMLFKGASGKRRDFDDLFSKPARDFSKDIEQQDVIGTTNARESDDTVHTEKVSVKDDLLADLFASEPRGSRHQQKSFISEKNKVIDDHDKTKVKREVDGSDQANEQSDRLVAQHVAPQYTNSTSEKEAKIQLSTEEHRSSYQESKPLVASAVTPASRIDDLASAKESLLMDLLGDMSISKTTESPLQHRRSNTNINIGSPIEDTEGPQKTSLPVKAQLPATIVEAPPQISSIAHPSKKNLFSPPSPEHRLSPTLNVNSEKEFEQAKDNLLKEILPLSPSASIRSSPDRRNSYSQSFTTEDDVQDIGQEIIHEEVRNDRSKVQVSVTNSESPKLHLLKTPHTKITSTTTSPVCNCAEQIAKVTAAFDSERSTFQQKIEALGQQLEAQTTTSTQRVNELTQEVKDRETSLKQLSQQLNVETASKVELTEQLALVERDKLQADHAAAKYKENAVTLQHRTDLLQSELQTLRDELSRSKCACQELELTLNRLKAEQDEVNQLERQREKRAFEALSMQMQRALARLSISHQVYEEGSGHDQTAARVAAEDEARLRVIASLEGSSKRAAQHAEQERVKLTELLRELEMGARHARQGAFEEKERLRQEQKRLDALSAHLQAQASVLRDQEAAHALYMGKQLAEAREDIRIQEARLATRRTELERDERALYQVRAEFAAFREQTAIEMERERTELHSLRLKLDDEWRELHTDREEFENELASHDGEFQALERKRNNLQNAEAQLCERTQAVVTLAEKLDGGIRELAEREQLVAQKAVTVHDIDASFQMREQALERAKNELQRREQRLHVQIRQLDTARERLMHQRQQHLIVGNQKGAKQSSGQVIDNNKPWRDQGYHNNFRHLKDKVQSKVYSLESRVEEDPSGLSPAFRKQIEANWQRRDVDDKLMNTLKT
ncbi:hypothetical protein Plhal304r1_c019g0067651 [Plasmopara halstedii]